MHMWCRNFTISSNTETNLTDLENMQWEQNRVAEYSGRVSAGGKVGWSEAQNAKLECFQLICLHNTVIKVVKLCIGALESV